MKRIKGGVRFSHNQKEGKQKDGKEKKGRGDRGKEVENIKRSDVP